MPRVGEVCLWASYREPRNRPLPAPTLEPPPSAHGETSLSLAPNEPESREAWIVACLRPAGFLGLGGRAGVVVESDFSEILEAEIG